MTINVNQQHEEFLTKRDLRDKNIEKDYILEKVKKLSLLADDIHASIDMVVEYYDVGYEAIKSLIKDNREELESDGLRVLRGKEVKSFKDLGLTGKYTSSFTIIPRRAILRIGMLLRDSNVARIVRDYLLNIESVATPEQRVLALEEIKFKKIDAIQKTPEWLLDVIDKKYLARVYEHYVGEGTQIEKQNLIVELSSYLIDKGLKRDQIQKHQSKFGRTISDVYLNRYGRRPKKLTKMVNGKERNVNYYEIDDLPLIDEVFEMYRNQL